MQRAELWQAGHAAFSMSSGVGRNTCAPHGFGLPPFEDRGSGYHFAILSRHQPATSKVATHPRNFAPLAEEPDCPAFSISSEVRRNICAPQVTPNTKTRMLLRSREAEKTLDAVQQRFSRSVGLHELCIQMPVTLFPYKDSPHA